MRWDIFSRFWDRRHVGQQNGFELEQKEQKRIGAGQKEQEVSDPASVKAQKSFWDRGGLGSPWAARMSST